MPKPGEAKHVGSTMGFGELVATADMEAMMAAGLRTEVKSKSSKLAIRLKLSGEQRMKLEEELSKQSERQMKLIKQGMEMIKNPGQVDGDQAFEEIETEDEAIARWAGQNLDDHQKNELAKYESERQLAEAAASAQYELDEIQEVIQLTEEQKEQVFQTLARRALEDTTTISGEDEVEFYPPEVPDGELAATLTAEQLETYRRYQAEEAKHAEELMKSMGIPGASEIQIQVGKP